MAVRGERPPRCLPGAVVTWQRMFDRFDALSRTRALTEQESRSLELAIWKLDRAAERRARRLTPAPVENNVSA